MDYRTNVSAEEVFCDELTVFEGEYLKSFHRFAHKRGQSIVLQGLVIL